MSTTSDVLEAVVRGPARWSRFVGLLGAGAIALAIVPLTSTAAHAAVINCVSSEFDGSCFEETGNYFGGEGEQSNIWKFFTDGSFETLLYTLEISGTPETTFQLDVEDVVLTQEDLEFAFEGDPALVNFPGAQCIPTFGEGLCGLFDVFAFGEVDWLDGFLMTITWFTNSDPLSQPPDDGQNTILRAPDYFEFTEALADIEYDPSPTPTDPGMSGRGDGFSRFGAFRTGGIPEPSTMLLFGVGLAAAVRRTLRGRSGR